MDFVASEIFLHFSRLLDREVELITLSKQIPLACASSAIDALRDAQNIGTVHKMKIDSGIITPLIILLTFYYLCYPNKSHSSIVNYNSNHYNTILWIFFVSVELNFNQVSEL